MPHRLDLHEGAESGGTGCSCEGGTAAREIDTLDRLGRRLLQELPEFGIGTCEIESVDVRMSGEVRSQFSNSSGQDVDYTGRHVRGRNDLGKGDRYARIVLGSDHHTGVAPGDHRCQHRDQAQEWRSRWRKDAQEGRRFWGGGAEV